MSSTLRARRRSSCARAAPASACAHASPAAAAAARLASRPLTSAIAGRGPRRADAAQDISFARVEGDGLRRVPQSVWAEVCKDAKCSILHLESNPQFDAYLLSESSLFIFPERMIAKTCGQTMLLNLIPHLFTLAEAVGTRPTVLTVRAQRQSSTPVARSCGARAWRRACAVRNGSAAKGAAPGAACCTNTGGQKAVSRNPSRPDLSCPTLRLAPIPARSTATTATASQTSRTSCTAPSPRREPTSTSSSPAPAAPPPSPAATRSSPTRPRAAGTCTWPT